MSGRSWWLVMLACALAVVGSVAVARPAQAAVDCISAPRVSVCFDGQYLSVYDNARDGQHTAALWSAGARTGKCENFYGAFQRKVSCALPVPVGTTICYRAAVLEGNERRYTSPERHCAKLTRAAPV